MLQFLTLFHLNGKNKEIRKIALRCTNRQKEMMAIASFLLHCKHLQVNTKNMLPPVTVTGNSMLQESPFFVCLFYWLLSSKAKGCPSNQGFCPPAYIEVILSMYVPYLDLVRLDFPKQFAQKFQFLLQNIYKMVLEIRLNSGVLYPDSHSPSSAGFDSHQFNKFFWRKENANSTTNSQMPMIKTVSCPDLYQFTLL